MFEYFKKIYLKDSGIITFVHVKRGKTEHNITHIWPCLRSRKNYTYFRISNASLNITEDNGIEM